MAFMQSQDNDAPRHTLILNIICVFVIHKNQYTPHIKYVKLILVSFVTSVVLNLERM